jgi:DNA-binding NarL/FixJ family response regulator
MGLIFSGSLAMCPSNSIRIVVASTQAAERFGLTVMIGSQADMEVVAQTGSIQDALKLLSTHGPDIALIDATLFDERADGTISYLREQQPRCRLLLLAMYDSDERIGSALRAGAYGYVLKGAAHGELLQAIRKAHAMGAR